MAFRKRFEVSNENLNSSKFWVSTAGLSIVNAQKNCPAYIDHIYLDLPVGHWENFSKEGLSLFADLVIEGANEREKEIIRKIENGDLKGASIGADPEEWSDDITLMKAGQERPTLVKSELFEISITALPVNQTALCLMRDGQPIRLNATNVNNIIPTIKLKSDMKALAIKLGLPENATESEILSAIDKIQLSKKNAETLTNEILDKASEGLEGEQKDIFVTLSKTNAKMAIAYAEKVKLSGEEKGQDEKSQSVKLQKDVKVSELVKLGKNREAPSESGKDSFDYLSKYNSVELARIRAEEPEAYSKLAREYKKGVRYTGKTA